MLFWGEQHDVGHAPPLSVWDISGMAVLKKGSDGDEGAYDLDDEEEIHPWNWTIVLGHIHRRHPYTTSVEDDAMKLAIHGLQDHSDHDAIDWDDALAVATSTLNPIALRLALIREELHGRPDYGQRNSHSHRNEIICVGYNEMFPAVLALADALGKEVVLVEYDPAKLKTVKKLYSEEKRRSDFRESKGRKGGTNRIVARTKSSDKLADEKLIEPGMRRVQSGAAMATVEEENKDSVNIHNEGDIETGVPRRV